MEKEDIKIFYMIGLSFLVFGLFHEVRMFRYIYPNYVGLLVIFSLAYILFRQKKQHIFELIVGVCAFIILIYRYQSLEDPELSAIIHRPSTIMFGVFMLAYAAYHTYHRIDVMRKPEKRRSKKRPSNLDVYDDDKQKRNRKYF